MKEINDFEFKLLSKIFDVLDNKNNITKYLESKEFKNSILELLDFEEVNGRSYLTKESKNKVKDIDPIDLMERLTGEKTNSDNIGGALMVTMIKRTLTDIIAENTYDISNTYKGTYQDYLRLFESFGFEKVLELEYQVKRDGLFNKKEDDSEYFKNREIKIIKKSKSKNKDLIKYDYEEKEVEFFLFNREKGLLIHGETFNGRINSVDLIGNVEVKPDMYLNGYSCGTIHGTHKKNISADLRDLPASTLEDILSKTIPIKEFLNFDYNFYSYLTHGDIEVGSPNWDITKAEKISKLPIDIIEQLLSKNINHQLLKEVNSYLVEGSKIEEKNKKEKDFMFNLPENFQKEISLRYEIFGGSKISYLSDELKEHIKNMNSNLDIKVCEDYCAYALKSQRSKDLDYQYCVDMFSKFKKEELEHSKKTIKYLLMNREQGDQLINYVEARLEFLNQPSNQKGNKRKLN